MSSQWKKNVKIDGSRFAPGYLIEDVHISARAVYAVAAGAAARTANAICRSHLDMPTANLQISTPLKWLRGSLLKLICGRPRLR